jgi:hypothetical protein
MDMLLKKAWQNGLPSATTSDFVNLVEIGFALFF